ncbi:hypothetical protein I553_9805 [Mycobacterium xenopi 4042]|uniref:Uncharacterized protein n=1 Tax=Mycobacterium xenopi 4042 TaxID=1299334 RepID=X7YQH9_MYCXE|nr:hypothetical protein I553_9805 [Mycobacterium xenopi 4042]
MHHDRRAVRDFVLDLFGESYPRLGATPPRMARSIPLHAARFRR